MGSKILCLDVFRVAEEIRVPVRVLPVSGASLGQYGNLESAIWPFWGYDDVLGSNETIAVPLAGSPD
ncbi:hypothetical protein PanWU01x14_305310 [Parasponia andersonii]|uniref:Uncharacterized protein n=1 Tax=Parasponia andersonii TaxID=3476 RepID=A0A2P5ASB0_PARAD|nr:hypothetical protein PanWU01x14_305310 [Parasponia andersonii]